jgi:hypothetical protein
MGSLVRRSKENVMRVLVTPILIALILWVLYWAAKPRSRHS